MGGLFCKYFERNYTILIKLSFSHQYQTGLQACKRSDYRIETRYDINDYDTYAVIYNKSTVGCKSWVQSLESRLSEYGGGVTSNLT